ncbi:hypothetical protein GCM10023149_53890 [Mucilaginibacter gynuensis]|uniref:Gliding motility-associated C-terminal domain-containing protein n=2 Tax=Mucilaginibacter gynuensis TaxID=1302236 RepID=A0ABP8HMT8_9SPHI
MAVAAVNSYAQSCTGNLGDAVLQESFDVDKPLGADVTTYEYTQEECLYNGAYRLAKRTSNCYEGVWLTLDHDHTYEMDPSSNSNMLMVAANAAPGVFYMQPTKDQQLCPGTTYQFEVWVINLVKPGFTNLVKPNLLLQVQTPDGQDLMAPYAAGDIPNDGQWHPIRALFTTRVLTTSVVVKISNNANGDAGNDLALDDISFRACSPAVSTGFDIPSVEGQPICADYDKTYYMSASAPVGYRNYQWQRLVNNTWIDIAGETNDKLTINTGNGMAAGEYQYRVAVTNDANIGSIYCRTYSSPNILTLPPRITASSVPVYCEGSGIIITASGAHAYVFTKPNGQTVEQTDPVFTIENATVQNSGTYKVQAKTASGCLGEAVLLPIKVKRQFSASVAAVDPICEGESVTLSATQTGGDVSDNYTYSWSPVVGLNNPYAQNPVASPTDTTTYTVTISNDACSASYEVTVNVLKIPRGVVTPIKEISEGQSVTLDATISGDITEYYWTPSTYLDNPRALHPVATPPDNIIYTLNLVGPCTGNEAPLSTFVHVFKKIVPPNAFSPNGDGINDEWKIDGLFTFPQGITTVYNRYGQEVFRSVGYSRAWNGTYNGTTLMPGVYYYIIDLKSNKPKITGWVMIMR